MTGPRRDARVTVRAPAKLNLRLRVLGPRPDGYHDIETHFVRLRLADEIRLGIGEDGIRLEVVPSGDAPGTGVVPEDARNLCWRAAATFFEAAGREPAASMQLTKRIPVAAGLGGGSSDAAAVLTGLNRIHGAPLSEAEVMRCAGGLGSDVPFFAAGHVAAVATGRGEIIRTVEAPPARPVLVVVPDFGVSAAEAYAWWREDEARGAGGAGNRGSDHEPGDGADGTDGGEGDAADLADWSALARRAVNDLASPVVARRPLLGRGIDALSRAGAELAILCGSGSCIAGVFGAEGVRDAARAALAEPGILDPAWRLLPTWTEGPRDP